MAGFAGRTSRADNGRKLIMAGSFEAINQPPPATIPAPRARALVEVRRLVSELREFVAEERRNDGAERQSDFSDKGGNPGV
jgi:hypothetical protein